MMMPSTIEYPNPIELPDHSYRFFCATPTSLSKLNDIYISYFLLTCHSGAVIFGDFKPHAT